MHRLNSHPLKPLALAIALGASCGSLQAQDGPLIEVLVTAQKRRNPCFCPALSAEQARNRAGFRPISPERHRSLISAISDVHAMVESIL